MSEAIVGFLISGGCALAAALSALAYKDSRLYLDFKPLIHGICAAGFFGSFALALVMVLNQSYIKHNNLMSQNNLATYENFCTTVYIWLAAIVIFSAAMHLYCCYVIESKIFKRKH